MKIIHKIFKTILFASILSLIIELVVCFGILAIQGNICVPQWAVTWLAISFNMAIIGSIPMVIFILKNLIYERKTKIY